MNGRAHTAVNAVSAITVNSFFHTIGTPYSWQQVVALVSGPHLNAALSSPLFLHKATYYIIVALCARLPDLDQRNGIGRLTGGHRGCTHSCLGVLIMGAVFFAVSVSAVSLLASHGIVLRPLIQDEVKVALESVVIGWVLHILADGLTRGGVPLFWPLPMRLGIPPVAFLRFKVGTIWEDIVLWSIIFFVGFGVGAGFLGL